MPEIKNTFTSGKMNKDLDERLVPNGEYRGAMNIEVSSSEDSDVGTVQNILGNKLIEIENFNIESAVTLGSIADEKIDTLYYLVWSSTADYIISYKRGDSSPIPIFVDKNKDVLKFSPTMKITGINVIDDMLFWTDNLNEPKKINIPRCKKGCIDPSTNQPDWNSHTKLINESQDIDASSNEEIEEKHITIIKKAPTTTLSMDLVKSRDIDKIYTAVVEISSDNTITNSFTDSDIHDFSTFSVDAGGDNTFNMRILKALDASGNEITLGSVGGANGLTGWQVPNPDYSSADAKKANILPGTKIVLRNFDDDGSPPGIPVTDFVMKGIVEDAYPDTIDASGNIIEEPMTTYSDAIRIRLTTIDGYPPRVETGFSTRKYVIDLFDETEKLFEFKFPRFSYRYKYEDGEYSPFAPFTQVAFSPGSFDYHPRKGYNLGMTNAIEKLVLKNIITEKTPKDVISVDILFKDEPSPNIYVVETIRADDAPSVKGATKNLWQELSDSKSKGYEIKKETINSVVPSNQLLRSWDNVPRKALAQDVTGNRIVYGNYVQNYNLIGYENKKYQPGNFDISWDEFIPTLVEEATKANKSIKSLREYQLGVVFTDEYGRETPVVSNASAALKLEKERADKNNRIKVKLTNSENAPQDMRYLKFFVKETAGEYYNMAMDRWYDAEDGNIWLAFPSSDRNKIDIDSFLILKKGSDQDDLVRDTARYKVIAIENEAPDYIKTNKILASAQSHFIDTNNLFDTGIEDAPLLGRDEFKVLYKPYLNSPGADLDRYREGNLYVEFGEISSDVVSDRYRVSSLSHNREITQSGGDDSANDITAQFSFKLNKNLGDDVNFITNDPQGTNPSDINEGTTVNIYKYEIENSPKFDGRFFVKIYSDEVFKNNIGKSFKDGLKERTITSKKIYYMDGHEHVDKITKNLGGENNGVPFGLTDGVSRTTFPFGSLKGVNPDYPTGNNGPQPTWGMYPAGNPTRTNYGSPSFVPKENTEHTDTHPEWHWGWYCIPDFLSFAFFFRRYIKSYDNRSTTNDLEWEPMFKPLSKKKTSVAFYSANFATHDVGGVFDREYLDERWYEIDNWGMEMGTNKFDGERAYVNHWRKHGGYAPAFWQTSSRWQEEDEEYEYRAARDAEVWFIDAGPREGKAGNDKGVNHWKGVKYSPDWGDGIKKEEDSWRMELGFGGIANEHEGNTSGTNEDFWNLHDWNTPAGASANNDYNDGSDKTFTQALEPGTRFRWREDPAGTIYTISADIKGRNYLRHSVVDGPNTRFIDSIFTNTSSGSSVFWPMAKGIEDHPVWALGGSSMAARLSHNFTKSYTLKGIKPQITSWNPTINGEIPDGMIITLGIVDENGNSSGSGRTCTGNGYNEDLIIYTDSVIGVNNGVKINGVATAAVHEGMALKRYIKAGTSALDTMQTNIGNTVNVQEFMVVRYIEKETSGDNTYYKLYLGGYENCLKSFSAVGTSADYSMSTSVSKRPKIGESEGYEFVQVGMNSYSPNSEFNINTIGRNNLGLQDQWGAVGAVGYTMDIIEPIEPEQVLSENPAIFETEPKDIKELDIYYEGSAPVPISFGEDNVHEAFPIGSYIDNEGKIFTVVGYRNEKIYLDKNPDNATSSRNLEIGSSYIINRPDGLSITILIKDNTGQSGAGGIIPYGYYIQVKENLYSSSFRLPWHNCYSFGNGVESNRIRDNFNLPFIANGVKVSTTLEHEYEEEHRKYGLIYSGIYNSTSGINNLNQFIAGEKITKDINPIYGSIQKLHSRDTDLVTLCEDKVLKILANKDAVFNADSNPQLIATPNVLGQTVPFVGEYGISTNPESFASESYRAYFSDKVRGTIMRLSRDGLTPISDHGMRDWFRDNLKLATCIKGSYDDRKDEYNVKLERYFLQNKLLVNDSKILTFKEDIKGWASFKSFIEADHAISMGNDYYTFYLGKLYKHHVEGVSRNTFYDNHTSSSIDVLLNNDPSSVKLFSTLNYEGSQSKIDKFINTNISLPFQPDTTYNDQEFYNLSDKKGWHVESIITNKEDGYIREFLEKEGKWFNYINKDIDYELLQSDTGDFSFQGIGIVNSVDLSLHEPSDIDDDDIDDDNIDDDDVDNGDDGDVGGGRDDVIIIDRDDSTNITVNGEVDGITASGGTDVIVINHPSDDPVVLTELDPVGPRGDDVVILTDLDPVDPRGEDPPDDDVIVYPCPTLTQVDQMAAKSSTWTTQPSNTTSPWNDYTWQVVGPNGVIVTSGSLLTDGPQTGASIYVGYVDHHYVVNTGGSGTYVFSITFSFPDGTTCTQTSNFNAIIGCTDPASTSYNSQATVNNDAMCRYPAVTNGENEGSNTTDETKNGTTEETETRGPTPGRTRY